MKIKPAHIYEAFNKVLVYAFNMEFYYKSFVLFVVMLLFWFYVPLTFVREGRLKEIQQSGEVIEGHVMEIGAEKEKLYKIQVKFGYTFRGTEYISEEVYPEKVYTVYEKDEIFTRLAIGSIVPLQVNPEHPERAVYFMDHTPVTMPWDLFISGIFLSAFCLGGFFYWKRLK